MSRFGEARRVAGLGVAYDNELGGRMWVGAVDRRFLDLALEEAPLSTWAKFRKELYLGFRRNFPFGRQLMNPTLSARLASESCERAFAPDWQVALGGMGHAWHEPGRDRSTIGATARAERTSRLRGRVLQADLVWTALYSRAGFEGEALMKVGTNSVRPGLRFGWGKRLPPQAAFPLSGEDGFPELHLGERRGDREALFRGACSSVLVAGFRSRQPLKLSCVGGGSRLRRPVASTRTVLPVPLLPKTKGIEALGSVHR